VPFRQAGCLGLLVLLVTACAGPSPAGTQLAPEAVTQAPRKSLTIGITSTVPAMSLAVATGTPTGGWMAMTELHTDGLVTSDANSRTPVGRLAEAVPTLENGGITLLPDGQMKVVFRLRQNVTWQDGAPFTAADLVFSYQIGGPGGIPTPLNGAVPYMSAVEAVDAHTLAVSYKSPFFQGAVLGPQMFWPFPEHLLREPYQKFEADKNLPELLGAPYWTSAYVSAGPFRLTQFDPGGNLTFEAYDGYYLGRPKISTVYVRAFADVNALFSNIIAGAVDIIPDLALQGETGAQLKRMWDASGDGNAYVIEGAWRRYDPQYRPEFQREPTVFDRRVRMALYQALDRAEISDGANGGSPELASNSLLAKSDPLHEATRDVLTAFPFNPTRSRALLEEAGWGYGPDGSLRFGSDGRAFKTALYTGLGNQRDVAASAFYWRQLGIEVEEHIWSAAETRDAAARAQYPGFDGTGGGILNLLFQRAATAQNNWVGNRTGYESAEGQQLVQALRGSVAISDQLVAMRKISDFFVADLPVLPIYYIATYLFARKEVRALTPGDVAGGVSDNPTLYAYGTFSRNAYLWERR
jgi:peptide/nickel transport system substrate-binding protein